jgi:hypothetical protein
LPFGTSSPLWNYAPYQLIYVGLSAGIGLGGGIVAAIFNCLDDDHYVLAKNTRIFDEKSGLYDDKFGKTYHYPTPQNVESQPQINSSSNLMS